MENLLDEAVLKSAGDVGIPVPMPEIQPGPELVTGVAGGSEQALKKIHFISITIIS